MDVRLNLIVLTMSNARLKLLLPIEKQQLPSISLTKGDPDHVACELAHGLSGLSEGVQRHRFLSPDETKSESLTLLYTQLIAEDQLQADQAQYIRLIPITDAGDALGSVEMGIVKRVVGDFKADLEKVMHSRLNKGGLVHLLDLLPDIFDHKELAAAYYALAGEKPPSPRALARMMLDTYAIGSGEKQREVKGRNLIREYESTEADLLGQKWDKNKDLYRTGGPKATRLYKKITQATDG